MEEKKEMRTSCIVFISSLHCKQRQQERSLTVRDLQAAVKYGIKEQGRPRKKTGEPTWKYTFANVVYITDVTSTQMITCWAESLPLDKAPIEF